MRHPKGTRARVLLSSVFKPFAQDDGKGKFGNFYGAARISFA